MRNKTAILIASGLALLCGSLVAAPASAHYIRLDAVPLGDGTVWTTVEYDLPSGLPNSGNHLVLMATGDFQHGHSTEEIHDYGFDHQGSPKRVGAAVGGLIEGNYYDLQAVVGQHGHPHHHVSNIVTVSVRQTDSITGVTVPSSPTGAGPFSFNPDPRDLSNDRPSYLFLAAYASADGEVVFRVMDSDQQARENLTYRYREYSDGSFGQWSSLDANPGNWTQLPNVSENQDLLVWGATLDNLHMDTEFVEVEAHAPEQTSPPISAEIIAFQVTRNP